MPEKLERRLLLKKVNLHTHTAHCRHAAGTPDEYCAAALEHSFEILGFSDHAPFPDNRYARSRMAFAELSEYCREVRKARENFPMLRIPLGLEIEYCADLGRGYYEDLIGEYGLDYLIGSVHFVETADHEIHPFYGGAWASPEVLDAFVRQTVQTMENLPLLYLGHPDAFASIAGRMTPDLKSGFREIVAAAKSLGIPLEVNGNGFRKGLFQTEEGIRYRYPWDEFWEIAAEAGADVVIGCDAHHPDQIDSEYGVCLDYVKKMGLNNRSGAVAEKLLPPRG